MMCADSPRRRERRNTGVVPNPMLNRVLARHENWIGGLAGAAALAALVGVAAVASAQSTLPLQAVGWQNETLPGAACKAGSPIRLHNHVAQISHTGFGDVNSSGSNPDLVQVAAAYDVSYGQLGGVGPAAAVDVVCSNNGGTADGQIRFAEVVFSGSATNARAVGLITPQQPHQANVGHVPLLGKVKWVNGRIVVAEAWYGPNDPTCCASGRATTTWAYRTGKLTAVHTVVTKRPTRGTVAMSGATASAAGGSSPQIRAVYRGVLTAEYFGPAGAVCSRLTAGGVNSFTADGQGTCRHAFDALQNVLRHKTPGVDGSGFTPREWRMEVAQVMAHLKLSIHGAHATAIGPSGIPGQSTLVRVNGRWLFSSYPPSIEP
jgi:hypothetical protein